MDWAGAVSSNVGDYSVSRLAARPDSFVLLLRTSGARACTSGARAAHYPFSRFSRTGQYLPFPFPDFLVLMPRFSRISGLPTSYPRNVKDFPILSYLFPDFLVLGGKSPIFVSRFSRTYFPIPSYFGPDFLVLVSRFSRTSFPIPSYLGAAKFKKIKPFQKGCNNYNNIIINNINSAREAVCYERIGKSPFFTALISTRST